MRKYSSSFFIPAFLLEFLCLSLLIAMSLLFYPSSGGAAGNEMSRIVLERQRVENTLKDLRKQLDEYQAKLGSTKKNERLSMEALKNIRKQIQVYERLIAENQALLNNLDKEIGQVQSQLQENRQTYHHVSTDFQRIAIAAYKHGGDRNAELLFSSGSVSDFVSRTKYMGFLSRSVRSRVNDLQSSAQQMESSRVRLQETYHRKEVAMKSQQEQLQSYSSKQKEKEAVLSGIKKDKTEYATRIAEVRRKQRQMQLKIESLIMAQQELIQKQQERARQEAVRRQRLLAEKQAAIRRRKVAEERQREAEARLAARSRQQEATESTPPPRREEVRKEAVGREEARKEPVRREEFRKEPVRQAPPPPEAETRQEEAPVIVDTTEQEIDRVSANFDAGGSLPWPVNNGVIVRRFGSSRDRELNIVTISNGIDISVPVNTPVKSVSGGKVVQIAFLPTFGNVVIVRHPKSYLTVYANLARVSVANGEMIRSRQTLGSSAAMPEGGSIVHFEIWRGREKQNPQKWLR